MRVVALFAATAFGCGDASSQATDASIGKNDAAVNKPDASKPDASGELGPTCWPFNQPSLDVLRQSDKKVFAHYFSPYPLSLDNQDPANDYYARNYLSPDGEGGKHLAYGGFLRERPLPQAPWADGVDFQAKNMELEVQRALAIGLDGFSYDVLNPNPGSPHRKRLELLLDAALAVDPVFEILLVPDMTTTSFGGAGGSNADALAALLTLADAVGSHPSVMKLDDGRIIMSPFAAERRDADFWNQAMTALADAGHPIALVPMTIGSWSSNAAKFAGVNLLGASSWGARTVSGGAALATAAELPHSAGLLWMAPVAPQDSRPKNLLFTESNNSAAFRTQWISAIEGEADWVQLITWNDYSENSEMAPSSQTTTAFYDLSAYFITWFKTGIQPEIARDSLYYFHRAHSMDPSVAAPNLAKQDHVMAAFNGPSTSTDEIELVGLLTEPGTLEIQVGEQVFTEEVEAGIQRMVVPLAEGTPRFRLRRGQEIVVEVEGHTTISNTIEYQDPLYHAGAEPTCRPAFSPGTP